VQPVVTPSPNVKFEFTSKPIEPDVSKPTTMRGFTCACASVDTPHTATTPSAAAPSPRSKFLIAVPHRRRHASLAPR